MNKTRRIQLEAIAQKLESLQGDLYTIMNEEEESYDNMPESVQGGEKGETARAVIELLEEAGCSFDDLVDSIRAAAE